MKTRRKNAKPQKDLKGNIKKSIDEMYAQRLTRNIFDVLRTPH